MTRFVLVALLVSAFVACSSRSRDTRTADELAIRDTDSATLKAAQANDIAKVADNYAEDAVWLPPNAPMETGREAIRAGWSRLLTLPSFKIDWRITKLDVSRSGDMAYTVYAYQMTFQRPDGSRLNDHGKDLVVWKKQSDASWKMIAESFNSDLAAPSMSK